MPGRARHQRSGFGGQDYIQRAALSVVASHVDLPSLTVASAYGRGWAVFSGRHRIRRGLEAFPAKCSEARAITDRSRSTVLTARRDHPEKGASSAPSACLRGRTITGLPQGQSERRAASVGWGQRAELSASMDGQVQGVAAVMVRPRQSREVRLRTAQTRVRREVSPEGGRWHRRTRGGPGISPTLEVRISVGWARYISCVRRRP